MAIKYSKERTYCTQQGGNLALGQAGSILVKGTTAVTCATGIFVAIQFLEDTTFNTSDGGLSAETLHLYPDDTGESTLIDSNGGGSIDSVTFPQGMTIFGRWTGFTLATGACIAYVG